jgi:putative Mg2+ transporter-C (MgtC) family protein
MMALQHIVEALRNDVGGALPSTMLRLGVAGLLGAAIGLEREWRHKPAGLRTNLFICFGAAMFTLLSDRLAGGFGGDHTRVAAQIIPGIGFIGAGSILHSRASVTGLTTAATIFVVAGVGMAAGGGLYATAGFATVIILIALALLGWLESRLESRQAGVAYEATGASTDAVLDELNRILDANGLSMREVHANSAGGHARVMFSVEAARGQHEKLNLNLHRSSILSSVVSLGRTESE